MISYHIIFFIKQCEAPTLTISRMARTKQTARKSSGGKAPRKNLRTKAARILRRRSRRGSRSQMGRKRGPRNGVQSRYQAPTAQEIRLMSSVNADKGVFGQCQHRAITFFMSSDQISRFTVDALNSK